MASVKSFVRKVMLVLGVTSIPHISFADDDTLEANLSDLPSLVFNDGNDSIADPLDGLCDVGDVAQVVEDRNVVVCISQDGGVTGAAPLE